MRRYEAPRHPPRHFAPAPDTHPRRRRLSETSQEDGEAIDDGASSPKRARVDENSFFDHVKRELGERAHHHVTSILQRKPEVVRALTDRCHRAVVMKGRHHMVHNKNAFVAGMRAAFEIDGVITSFFSFEGFKIIIFVDDDFDKGSLEAIVADEGFKSQFCLFDHRGCVEVALE